MTHMSQKLAQLEAAYLRLLLETKSLLEAELKRIGPGAAPRPKSKVKPKPRPAPKPETPGKKRIRTLVTPELVARVSSLFENGLSYGDIGKQLGLATHTVAYVLKRARRRAR